MDVCVVTYRNDARRIRPALRPHDQLWVRDNTRDNIGFAAGANELAGRGHQPIILFVNPDGDPRPGCFDLLETAFDDPAIVATEASQGEAWTGDIDETRATWLAGACLAVRRPAFEQVGGFDESLFMYCEDYELSRRLATLGRLAHTWDAVFAHDAHKGSIRAYRYMTRNHLILGRRGTSPWPSSPSRAARGAVSDALHGNWRAAAGRCAGIAGYLRWRARGGPGPVLRRSLTR